MIPYEASRWLELPFLIDRQEMETLLEELAPYELFPIGQVVSQGSEPPPFLDQYSDYIECLQKGQIPNESKFSSIFSLALTKEKDAIYSIAAGNDRSIFKIARPVIQISLHHFDYSEIENKFRSNIRGRGTISWGLLFAYPQLFMNPETGNIEKALEHENGKMLRFIQKWMRHHTTPTRICTEKGCQNVPIRLGKGCMAWIDSHPQLKERNLTIEHGLPTD